MDTYSTFGVLRPWAMLFLALLCPLTPPPARGQVVTGSLTVRVLDPNGEPVPDATVTAKNLETGLERTQSTIKDGSATFGDLPPRSAG